MDEDWPACTEEEPLNLDLRALSFLFSIADQAGQLLNAVLNQQPIAEPARQLAVDLYELNMAVVGGEERYSNYAEALLEVHFTDGVFLRGNNDAIVSVDVWKKDEEDEKKTG